MQGRGQRAMIATAAVMAAALGGSALADAASNSSANQVTSSQSNSAPSNRPAFNGPAPGSAKHEDAEKAATGTEADKAKAAAIKSVGSGTASSVTSNFTGDGYEVVVTKADGSNVEVHLDSSFNVQAGPGAHGVDPDPNDNDGPGTSNPAGSIQ